jgi:hypothetical protein
VFKLNWRFDIDRDVMVLLLMAFLGGIAAFWLR